jgi:hypothetical protein
MKGLLSSTDLHRYLVADEPKSRLKWKQIVGTTMLGGTVGFEPETAILSADLMNCHLPFQECGDHDCEFCNADQ